MDAGDIIEVGDVNKAAALLSENCAALVGPVPPEDLADYVTFRLRVLDAAGTQRVLLAYELRTLLVQEAQFTSAQRELRRLIRDTRAGSAR